MMNTLCIQATGDCNGNQTGKGKEDPVPSQARFENYHFGLFYEVIKRFT
jgi:hypothetical protein